MLTTFKNNVRTLSFFGIVGASSRLTLVSQRIHSPFTLRRITASFALNTNRNLRLSFFISGDNEAPTDSYPTGFNVLGEYGQVDFIVGDDEQKELFTEAYSPEFPSYFKVHALNLDAVFHTVDVQVEIEIFER